MNRCELENIAHRHAVAENRTYIKNTSAHWDRGQLLDHIKELYDAYNPDNTFDPRPATSLRDKCTL